MSSNNSENNDSPYLPWIVILMAIGILLLFILRRSLIRLFPILLVVAIFLPMIVYLYRRHKYRNLEGVYAEYSQLTNSLQQRGMNTYLRMANRSMDNMLFARDKAEHIREMIHREDVTHVRNEIASLKEQLEKECDNEKKTFLKKSLSEHEQSAATIDQLTQFLDRYENSKTLLEGYFKNIRIKIEIHALSQETTVNQNIAEVDQIIEDVEQLNQIYDRVDKITE